MRLSFGPPSPTPPPAVSADAAALLDDSVSGGDEDIEAIAPEWIARASASVDLPYTADNLWADGYLTGRAGEIPHNRSAMVPQQVRSESGGRCDPHKQFARARCDEHTNGEDARCYGGEHRMPCDACSQLLSTLIACDAHEVQRANHSDCSYACKHEMKKNGCQTFHGIINNLRWHSHMLWPNLRK